MKSDENQRTRIETAGYIAGVGMDMMRGKHMSASIIVLVGAMLILGGSYRWHDDTRLFVQIVGLIVLVIGLGSWFVSGAEK
jgi:hypothetical protein